MSEGPLRVWMEREGRLLRLRLARPKANILDAALIAALDGALAEVPHAPDCRGVLLDHEGPHFSFGASVQEHLPGQCADMLKGFHGLVRRMLDCPAPILVALRGRCLGGGLEVACAGGLIFAAPDAELGQPEVRLGVFAPAASCLLPERIGQAKAEDLLLTGRSISADEAAAMGLVHAVAGDPEGAALEYFNEHLAGLSGSSLRFALRASREAFAARVKAGLARAEELYLSGLMSTRDAVEGLQAFLEKRPAVWRNR